MRVQTVLLVSTIAFTTTALCEEQASLAGRDKLLSGVPRQVRDDCEKTPEGKHKEIRAQLLRMKASDQELRKRWIEQGVRSANREMIEELHALNGQNAKSLQKIIENIGAWPGSNYVGEEGADAAWTIAQHAPLEYQLQFVGKLRSAVRNGCASPMQLARMIDRVRIRSGQKQLYGTQFSMEEGELKLNPVADRGELSERRQQVGLPPIEVMREELKRTYKLNKSDQGNSEDE